MKKTYIAILVALCFAFSLCLAGCGGGSDEKDKVDVPEAQYQQIYDDFQVQVDKCFTEGTSEMQKLVDQKERRNVLSKEHNYWQAQLTWARDDANKAIDALAATDKNPDAKKVWKDKISQDYDKNFNDMREIYIGFINILK